MFAFVRGCTGPLSGARGLLVWALLIGSTATASTPAPPPFRVTIGTAAVPVREFGKTPYVPWEAFADALGLEHYYSEATGVYSLVNGAAGKEMALEFTPGSRELSVNGEVRRLPAVPLIKDGLVWLPVKPFAEILGKPARSLRFSRAPAPARPPPPAIAPPIAARATPTHASSAAPSPKGKRSPGLRLPPMPKISDRQRTRFGEIRVAIFARTAAAGRGEDPDALRALGQLARWLEEDGFQVHEMPPAAGWPSPTALNALRPHLTILLEASPRTDRFWVYFPIAPPAPGSATDGAFGPSTQEAALSRQLGSGISETMLRSTGVTGQAAGDALMVPISRLLGASVLIDFPARSGAPGPRGETALARGIHDGVVATLGADPTVAAAADAAITTASPTTPTVTAPQDPTLPPVTPPTEVTSPQTSAAPASDANTEEADPPGADTPAQEEPDPSGADTPAVEDTPLSSAPAAVPGLELPGAADSGGTYTPLQPDAGGAGPP